MKLFFSKFTSRKFITAFAGILTGVGVICTGNITEGIIAVIASVLAYLVAEGCIDAKAVDIADAVIEETKDKLEGDCID
jgi:hypothetical protein